MTTMKAFIAVLLTVGVCASVQAVNFSQLRSPLPRVALQRVTGEQYDARIRSMKKWRGNANSRIVGGNEATLGQLPFQAAVSIDAGYFCGGSLVSTNYVITAGHCGVLGNSFTIHLGTLSPYDFQTRQVVKSHDVKVHEQYDPNSLYGDISILKLAQSVSFNQYISPISLPSMGDQDDYTGIDVIASGWGKTSDDASGISPVLKYTHMTTISNDECANYYGDIISNSQICTVTSDGSSTCNGDSGGPLHTTAKGSPLLIGVISFVSGAGCESRSPTGYTRVTTFRDWISQNSDV